MKVITTYMADDGATFATEEECKRHEEKHTKSFYEVYDINALFFDEEGNRLSGTFDYLMERCYYIYIHSKKDFNELVKINNDGGCYELPKCEGLWSFNFDNDTWENYEQQIKYYKAEIETSENIDYQIENYFLLKN